MTIVNSLAASCCLPSHQLRVSLLMVWRLACRLLAGTEDRLLTSDGLADPMMMSWLAEETPTGLVGTCNGAPLQMLDHDRPQRSLAPRENK